MDTDKKDSEFFVGGSILIGAILISVSIYFAADKIANGPSFIDNQNQNQNPNPSAGSAKIEVEKRTDAPRIGNGKVEIVEFSDFQCPFCQQFFNTAYKEIKAKYIDTGKATLVYQHFPLSIHANAQKSAEASECANKQGKFEAYYNTLFTSGKADGTGLAVPDLKKYAVNLGLDTVKFNSCLDSGETVGAVKKDFEEGQTIGVSGTPTFIINGERIVGSQPFTTFEAVIERALKQK